MSIILIDSYGRPADIPEAKALARKIDLACFVRATAEGNLFDPVDSDARLTQKDRERGALKYTFRRCSMVCYADYLSYLQSRNKAFLLTAQRRFHDDTK